jgi:pyruvate/2-oxoglutarate dehydrogenase complex dihydrolipoamide acyltransferase (E2) component
VHVGVAVAVEDGLITPVVRDADRKRVRDIAVEVKELAGRAREKKLKPEEYTGATFSISNLGMFGITSSRRSSIRRRPASSPSARSRRSRWSRWRGRWCARGCASR